MTIHDHQHPIKDDIFLRWEWLHYRVTMTMSMTIIIVWSPSSSSSHFPTVRMAALSKCFLFIKLPDNKRCSSSAPASPASSSSPSWWHHHHHHHQHHRHHPDHDNMCARKQQHWAFMKTFWQNLEVIVKSFYPNHCLDTFLWKLLSITTIIVRKQLLDFLPFLEAISLFPK